MLCDGIALLLLVGETAGENNMAYLSLCVETDVACGRLAEETDGAISPSSSTAFVV